jgi:GTP-binding protein
MLPIPHPHSIPTVPPTNQHLLTRLAPATLPTHAPTPHTPQQDFRLSELIARQGCAVVIAVNKWDRVDPKLADDQQAYIDDVKAQLRHVGWAGVVCTNARRGRGVPEVLEAVLKAGEQHRRRVSTATLNMVVREAVSWKAPPSLRGSGRQGRVYYATQAATQPPTFVLFVNDPRLFSDDYRR